MKKKKWIICCRNLIEIILLDSGFMKFLLFKLNLHFDLIYFEYLLYLAIDLISFLFYLLYKIVFVEVENMLNYLIENLNCVIFRLIRVWFTFEVVFWWLDLLYIFFFLINYFLFYKISGIPYRYFTFLEFWYLKSQNINI